MADPQIVNLEDLMRSDQGAQWKPKVQAALDAGHTADEIEGELRNQGVLSTAVHAVAGAVKETVNPAEAAKGVEEEIRKRGPAVAAVSEGAKLGLSLVLGGPGTEFALSKAGIERAATSAAGHRAIRYLLMPSLTGAGTAAIEGATRLVTGEGFNGDEMTVEALAAALSQWPAAFMQARSFRAEEIMNLNRQLREMQEGTHPLARDVTEAREQRVRGALYEGAVAEKGKTRVTGGVAQSALDLLRQHAADPTKTPPLDELGARIKRELVVAEGRANKQKNALYDVAKSTMRGLGKFDVGAGPDVAAEARDVLAILKRTSSVQTAVGTGPAQLATQYSALEEEIDKIRTQAEGLQDIPYETYDRWRSQLQAHAPNLWQRSRTPETYQRGTLKGFFQRLNQRMDAMVKGTPAEQQLQAANQYYADEVVRIRNAKNKASGDPSAVIDAYRNALRGKAKSKGEMDFAMRHLESDTQEHIRALGLEDWLARHQGDDGAIDVDKLIASFEEMRKRPMTAERDMHLTFGQATGPVRKALDALKTAQSFARLNENPKQLQLAEEMLERGMKDTGLKREQLVLHNQQSLLRTLKTTNALAVPFEAFGLLTGGHWKVAIGSMLNAPLGVAFLARVLSDRNEARILARMNTIADTAANQHQLARLGSQLVAHFLYHHFTRAERANNEIVQLGSSLISGGGSTPSAGSGEE